MFFIALQIEPLLIEFSFWRKPIYIRVIDIITEKVNLFLGIVISNYATVPFSKMVKTAN